jgi:hypothetical protein
MKLFLLTQRDNTGYDTYDSMIVTAPDEGMAVSMNPYGETYPTEGWDLSGSWARRPDYVRCEYLGEASEGSATGVVLASFNAG